MRLPWVSRASVDDLQRRLDAERERLITVLQKQAEEASSERRATQDRLIQAIDGQSALMVQVTQQLAKLNRPAPPAESQYQPSLEELAESRATQEQVVRIREGLLAEADRVGNPMDPKEAEKIAREMLSIPVSGVIG